MKTQIAVISHTVYCSSITMFIEQFEQRRRAEVVTLDFGWTSKLNANVILASGHLNATWFGEVLKCLLWSLYK